jgi:hypothetical protein
MKTSKLDAFLGYCLGWAIDQIFGSSNEAQSLQSATEDAYEKADRLSKRSNAE